MKKKQKKREIFHTLCITTTILKKPYVTPSLQAIYGYKNKA